MNHVSIIMTAYNVKNYIEEAVYSVIQTEHVRSYELIIIDDCSTDGTWELIESLTHEQIRIYRNETNLGLAASRNIALNLANGEWVTFLDADDLYLPGRIDYLSQIADATEADMVADDVYNFIDGDFKNKVSMHSRDPVKRNYMTVISTSEYIEKYTTTVPLIKRSFINDNHLRFNEDYSRLEDFEFWITCMLKGAKFIWVREAFYCYRGLRPNSLSKNLYLIAERELNSISTLEALTPKMDDDIAHALDQRRNLINNRIEIMKFKDSVRARDLKNVLKILYQQNSVRSYLIDLIFRKIGKYAKFK